MSASAHDLDVAVIGMACRFPGATTPEAFWANLKAGVDSISSFTDEELRAAGVPASALASEGYVKASAVLDDVDLFDAAFFALGAREAQLLDPQQRLFLEAAHEALERSGYDPDRHPDPIGLFAGTSASTYLLHLLAEGGVAGAASAYEAMIANDKDYLAPRVAYKLNLCGPAVVVQTACSTSLVAVHLACQSLLAGECDLALAGGVSIAVPQRVGYLHEEGGILSRDGKCRPFDAEASGTVKGNGLGIVVLKRLRDALRDGDFVQAVIRGSATNNDGARKVGFTAPAVDGQVKVIRAAHAAAGIEAASIGYVEAHGTATALGDPVEIAALAEAFRGPGTAAGSCVIGSVKGNFGHLDAAAGVAGFMKTVLMLQHGELVPSLHFQRPNPGLHLDDTPFRVGREHGPWRLPPDGPRRAGVSSFGIGGTNAHVVLEEHCPVVRAHPDPREGGEHILVVSARSPEALAKAASGLAAHLRQHPDDPLGPVEFTLLAGRRCFPHRLAVVASGAEEAARLLDAASSASPARAPRSATAPPVCLVFPGQGSQHPGMAADLYRSFSVFRAEFDACADALEAEPIPDLREVVFAAGADDPQAATRLARTDVTQPALFAVEWALARQLMAFGLQPDLLLGHSVGEYVAACLAGVMERDHAVRLVAARGRLMVERCAPGAMLAVAAAEEEVEARLREWFPREGAAPERTSGPEISVVNGPDSCVVGGTTAEIVELEGRLEAIGQASARLATSHAFHSRHMEPALRPFAALLARVPLHAPRIPFVSNLTGRIITAEEATDPSYWVRQLRGCVRFSEGVALVLQAPDRILLETGPGAALSAMARRRLPTGAQSLSCLAGPRRSERDRTAFRATLARLWAAGIPLDWTAALPPESRRRVILPTYPFERRRFWALGHGSSGRVAAPAPRPESAPSASGEAGARLPEEAWLYSPSWRRAEAPAAPGAVPNSFALLAEPGGLGEALTALIRSRGGRATLVRRGKAFAPLGPGEFQVHPGRAQDYDALVTAMGSDAHAFIHLWEAEPARGDETPSGSLEDDLQALSLLGQALARGPWTETSVLVVTRGAEEVLGTERMCSRTAALGGVARVLSQEHPNLAVRTVDLVSPPESRGEGDPGAEATWLLAESMAPLGPPAVAYRGPYRWVRAFDRLVPADEASPLGGVRAGGVYLVSGGLGTAGLALARFLAQSGGARLVLTSRSGLARGEGARRALGEVKGLAAEVLVRAADAADERAMREVVEEARARFGRLDGVIHAAGHLGPGAFRPLSELTSSDFALHLRPKLEGARVLDAVLGDAPIDFVLTTSSLASDLGGLGLGAYASANRALDAFVAEQRRRGKRAWTSVLWDGFRIAEAAVPRARTEAITAEEAGRTLGRILAAGRPGRVLVSTTDLGLRAVQWTERASLRQDAPARGETLARHPRPPLAAAYAAPETEVERQLAALWAETLSLERVGLDDGFFELGGSSLLAVHLTGRIRRELVAELSVAVLFEAPTVRALARRIGQEQGSTQDLRGSADRGRLRKEAQRGRTVDAAVE